METSTVAIGRRPTAVRWALGRRFQIGIDKVRNEPSEGNNAECRMMNAESEDDAKRTHRSECRTYESEAQNEDVLNEPTEALRSLYPSGVWASARMSECNTTQRYATETAPVRNEATDFDELSRVA
jgi:hypothetical protein